MTDQFKKWPHAQPHPVQPDDGQAQKIEKKNAPNANTDQPLPQELLADPAYEELQKMLDQAEQKADQAEQKAAQYWERILRMQADTENATRRAEKEIENAHKYSLIKLAKELLPVIDSLELSLSNTGQEILAHAQTLAEGVGLTLRMLLTALEKYGVKQIDPMHSPFDPEYHQAISMQFDPHVKPGTVVSVLQKGYSLNGRLLRPALVVVAKAEA